MANQAQQREMLQAVEALLADQEAYARYQYRRGRRAGAGPERSRPVEYDESGFPLPQSRPGLAKRVARLLNT